MIFHHFARLSTDFCAGESTTSTQKSDRLSTGALVEQLALKGDRLHYKLRRGRGEMGDGEDRVTVSYDGL